MSSQSKVRLIKDDDKQRIAQEGLEAFIRTPPQLSIAFLTGVTLAAAAIAFFALWEFVGIDIIISAAVAVIIAIIGVPVLRRQLSKENKTANIMLDKYLQKFETQHGDKEKILREITEQVTQGPAFVTDNDSIITKDWYIAVNDGHIVKIEDIAAVVGSMTDGTFLLTVEGEKIPAFFGEDRWGDTFELLRASNPHLLDGDDAVEMPNGKDVRVSKVFEKQPNFVIDEFLRRKRGGNE